MSAVASSSTSAPPPEPSLAAAVPPPPPPPPPPPEDEGDDASLGWPANQPGLVCYFDPYSVRSQKTYLGLMRHTKDTLVTTAWVHAATHVLIDTLAHPDGLPLFLRTAYEGKVVVSSDWARDSVFEGAAVDVEDKLYQVTWVKEEEAVEAVADRKGKRREREDDEDNDDRPLVKKPSVAPSASLSDGAQPAPAAATPVFRKWTDEENMLFAEYLLDNPSPSWETYHQLHPERTISAYSQRYGCAKDAIDKCTAQIRRERRVKQAQPAPAAATSRPSDPLFASQGPLPPDEWDWEEGDDPSGLEVQRPRRMQKNHGDEPCSACGTTDAKTWHRLHELNTPEDWYCSACRGAFYPLCKSDLEAAKSKLQSRKGRASQQHQNNAPPPSSAVPGGSRYSPPSSEDDEPLSNGRDDRRQSLPSGSKPSSSASTSQRTSLPGPGPTASSSSYLGPPKLPHSSSSYSNKKGPDYDPRLEKRRKNLEKMGKTPPQPRPNPQPPIASSSSSSSSSSHAPAPPPPLPPPPQPIWSRNPQPDPFLSVGQPPLGCTSERWCHACGTASSNRFVRVGLREATEGGGVKQVDRVLCEECAEWWRRKKVDATEGEKVRLTRMLEEKGREERRKVVERRRG